MVTQSGKSGRRGLLNILVLSPASWQFILYYIYHLFCFYIFVNDKTSCLLYYLFRVIMSIKNLNMDSLSLVAYYLLTCNNWTPFNNFAERISIILQSNRGCFCRQPPSIFAEHFSVFFQTLYQYFYIKRLSSLA